MSEDEIRVGNSAAELQFPTGQLNGVRQQSGLDLDTNDGRVIQDFRGNNRDYGLNVDPQELINARDSGRVEFEERNFTAEVNVYDRNGNLVEENRRVTFRENPNDLLTGMSNRPNSVTTLPDGTEATVINPTEQQFIYSVTRIVEGRPNGINPEDFAGGPGDNELGAANIRDHKVEWRAPNGETITLFQPPTATSAVLEDGTQINLTGPEYGPTRQLYYYLERDDNGNVVVSDQEYRVRVSLEPPAPTPDTPDTPTPETPDTPDTPTPETPDTPDTPDTPTPETPDTPDIIPIPEERFIELVDRFQVEDRIVINEPIEIVRRWSEQETETVVEQENISTGFDPVNFAQRDSETGELTVADEGYAVSGGSDGIGGRYSWVLNNPIEVTTRTEEVPGEPIPGEPIVEALNFENGVLQIPENATGEITFSPREGVSMFYNNPPVIIALDANGQPLRAITANRDGSMSLDSEFLEGAAGVTTAIVPNGGNNGLEAGRVYDVRESAAYDGFALYDAEGNEIAGDSRSGASLISANSALNPGGRPMAVVDGNVVSFEDNAGLGEWRSDFDLNDYTVGIDGNTYTPTMIPTTETVVHRDIDLDPVVYGGVQANTNMQDSASVGVHLGIEQNPLRVNDQNELVPNSGLRLFADGQLDVGVAPQITTEITTITDYESRQEGIRTEEIHTMQEGEVRTVVNETTGEVVSVTRLEGDRIEVSRSSSISLGAEQVSVTGQRTEIDQSEALGVVGSATARLGVKLGVDPNIADAGDINGRVYVEGQVQTNDSASLSAVGEAGVILDADGSSSTSLNARVRQGLAGDNAGDTQFSAEIRHGGNSSNRSGPSELSDEAVQEFFTQQREAIQSQSEAPNQFAGIDALLNLNNFEGISFTEVEGLSAPLGTGQTPQQTDMTPPR